MEEKAGVTVARPVCIQRQLTTEKHSGASGKGRAVGAGLDSGVKGTAANRARLFPEACGAHGTCNLFHAVGANVQQHRAVDDAAPQLREAVQGQRGHVGLAPALAAIFHILLKLQPPADIGCDQPHGKKTASALQALS